MKKKMSKRTLTPKLRFPEFLGEPGWEEVPLVQIAERTTTKNLDGTVARVLTNSAEHGILDQRDYFDKDIANAGNIDGYYIVDLGDYVYNPRVSTLAPVGPISRNNIGKGVMSPLYTVFRFTDENTDFFQHYFKTVCWHLYLRRVSSMGARHDRMSITTSDFMAMPVPTPPAREQEKIADCLGSLDGLIAAEGRKLAALRGHKRGIMQQLFPQPGQTQPRLRFPEFQKEPGWQENQLSQHITLVSGIHLSPTEYGTRGDIPYFTGPSDFTNSELYVSKWTTHTENKGVAGDILITVKGSGVGELWYLELSHAALGRQLMAVRPLNGVSRFYFQLLLSKRRLFEDLAMGNLIPGLSRGDILKLKTPLPKEEEQQRIADCLFTLDTQITAQASKIDALKQHKRGLMQGLFPEVTGSEKLEVRSQKVGNKR